MTIVIPWIQVMRKMNEYERHAYLYSAWTALFIPCCLTIYVAWNVLPTIFNSLHTVQKAIEIFASIAVVYAAIGFYVRELFRSTSKLLFQFPLFKEDESKMPTTELLLWKNKLLSSNQIVLVHHKLKSQYRYEMLDEQQEQADEQEARRNIVGAVGLMRKATRGNKILEQCNYRYGYQRNMLGGLCWAFILVLIFLIVNYVCGFPFVFVCWLALTFILLQGTLAFFFMKYASKNYARTLITTFISK